MPRGAEPEPIALPHFPSRLHAFIWRNWGLVPEERLARLLQAPVEDVRRVAASLGLPAATATNAEMERRGYLTLIRQNWHLLPHEQILALLGWSETELAYTLREDDFFWIKLGRLKPRCEPLRFKESTGVEKARAEKIRALVTSEFGEGWPALGEPRFAFIKRLSEGTAGGQAPLPAALRPAGALEELTPRFLYSYFALYGDPLLTPELDPYPEGYLARLAAIRVDGIWLQAVLRRLTHSPLFPEDGRDADRRLASLAQLVERAARHGIGVFLYLNEPRAMPDSFFKAHLGLRGTSEPDATALCTSAPEVKEFLQSGVASIFRAVPRLRGVFTISMSENFTNCYSHNNGAACPRCSKRAGPEVVAEVNSLIATGAWEGRKDAEVIVWDWGWPDDWVEAIVEKLPGGVRLQSVSEWSLPIERGGVKSQVGEYSISAVGPGPRARRHWEIAAARGLRTGAKVQLSNTWELAAVPYVPALYLVAEHLAGLRRSGASSLMLSWTLGGYPSPNLELAGAFYSRDIPEPDSALRALAERRYGAQAPAALRAWRAFSDAFKEFPYDGGVLYQGPQQLGPANLLHPAPTGYRATMVGFPYDDLDGWRAIYPAEVFASQFEKLAKGWENGVEELKKAAASVEAGRVEEARRDLDVAEACALHFESVAQQSRFILARGAYLKSPDGGARRQAAKTMREIAGREALLARRLFFLASRDSRLGYEASNHYFYLPRDLVEKFINCQYVAGTLAEAE